MPLATNRYTKNISSFIISYYSVHKIQWLWLVGLWCLTPLSTIIQLYILLMEETRVSGENHRLVPSHCQTWSHNVVSSTPQNERISNSQLLVVIGTNCTGSYKSNYYTITATTARLRLKVDPDRCLESDITLARHKHRWGKTGLLLSYQIRSFVVQ